MTTQPPTRTSRPPFDLRRATGALLLLSGSLALGLTTYWLGSGHAPGTAGAAAPTGNAFGDDQGWAATTDDDWDRAAPQATYAAQPQGWTRGTTRGS